MKEFTQEEVAARLGAARVAAGQAETARVQQLKQQAAGNGGQPVEEECGGAMPLVKLDGRTGLAKTMMRAEHTGVRLSPMKTAKFRGYYGVHVRPDSQGDPQVNFQNCSMREKAAEAIAKSLAESFGLKTSVWYWRD